MDEYVSEIMLGGRNTIAIHNTCEDSLLASPLILDLAIIAELCDRITFRRQDEEEFHGFNAALSILSILCKAPITPRGTPVMNAFFKQRACIENIFRACIGLAPVHHMGLEYKEETIQQCVTESRWKSANQTYYDNGSGEPRNGVHLNGASNHIVNGFHNGAAEIDGRR